jgi:hypothetical protein
MKQTAVEWLVKNLKDFPHIKHSQSFKELIKQAKEMEKKQIINAYFWGRFESDTVVMSDKFYAKQYYNETFKTK